MPADALLLHHVVGELGFLEGARIDRIFMPTYEDVVFFIRAKDKNVKLLISLSSVAPRCVIAEKTGENPDTPFGFLMHLRKHLTGAIIDKIEQIPSERVIRFSLTGTCNMFEAKKYFLYVELVGKFSNAVLTDESGKITDSAKHLPLDVTTRAVLPGLKYELPPAQSGKSEIGDKSFFVGKTTALYDGGGLSGFLQKNFIGFAPASLKEAVARSGLNEQADVLSAQDAGALYDAFVSLYDDYRPALLVRNGKYEGFYPSPYVSVTGEWQLFPGISAAIEKYASEQADKTQSSARVKKLQLIVNQNVEHCKKNEKIFAERIRENENCDENRIIGDLIVSNIYKIKQGDESVLVDDYYTGGTRKIALDKKLSPSKNAAAYYKKYDKAKTTLAKTREMISLNADRLDYLDSLSASLMRSSSVADVDEIEREMIEQKLIKKSAKAARIKRVAKPTEVKIDGYRVLIGKNNYQNDELVKKSDKNFLWLHAQKIHGSHVVIEGVNIPQEVINQAAAYCAYYSKAQASGNVPVDYTLIKHVKKPSGAAPGKVIYTNQQTVNVTPKQPKL
ncbi:MAG: NFACT family protein [Candidatus Neoclostridium sp.]